MLRSGAAGTIFLIWEEVLEQVFRELSRRTCCMRVWHFLALVSAGYVALTVHELGHLIVWKTDNA